MNTVRAGCSLICGNEDPSLRVWEQGVSCYRDNCPKGHDTFLCD